MEGGAKSAIDEEVIGPDTEKKKTLQQLVKDLSDKSVMDLEVIRRETEESMSEAVEEAEEAEEEIWQIRQHIPLLGIKEKFAKKEAALLAGMYSTSGKSSMWRQAEEESGKKSEMKRQAEEDMMDYFVRLPPERCHRALKLYYAMEYEAAQWKALVAEAEKRKALLARQEKSARREKARAKAKAIEEAGKTEASVTEAGRPQESVAESGRPEEAMTVGSSKSAAEVMGKETMQQLLKYTSNRFAILDLVGDDETDEIGRHKLTIEEEHMPSDGMNPSDRGEESMTVGSGKSAMDQEVISPETEEPVTEAEEAVKEAEEGVLLVGIDSTGGVSSMRKKTEESGKKSEVHAEKAEEAVAEEDYFPKVIQRAKLDIQKKWAKKKNNSPDKETLQQMVIDLSDKFDISMRNSSAIEGHTPMVQSDKMLLLQPADPSATNSMTKLGVQDDLHHDRATTSAKTADEEMAYEAKNFAKYRRGWESAWGKTCNSFEHMTALSSMQFTYYTPGRMRCNDAASTPATLQICSIKLSEIAGGLRWPLSVYGVVAVRDVVDHNRNFLFSCDRDDSQELTQDDPFLRLIGPSRAVVYTDKVRFEIQLKVKGPTGSQDKPLITEVRRYNELFDHVSAVCFKNCFCTMELCVQVVRSTIQATILGIQVVRDGLRPFKYGARVTCSPVPGKRGFPNNPASGEIVMVDSKDGYMLYGSDGYLHLPRSVISVETEGRLDVDILAYSKSGKIAAQGHVSLPPQFSKISQRNCFLGGVEVMITVAWSRVATDKDTFMALGELSCVT